MILKDQFKANFVLMAGVIVSVVVGGFSLPTFAQDAGTKTAAAVATKLGDQHIPIDGVVLMELRASELMKSNALKLLPMEIAEAWSLDNIGVSPAQCKTMRFVAAAPVMGPQPQAFAAMVVEMNEPFAITDLNSQLIYDDPEEIDGHTCYVMKGPPGVVFHQPDPKTIMIASAPYLDAVVNAAEGGQSGALAKLSSAVGSKGQFTMLVAVEPIRPLINGALQMFVQQLPPQLVQFADIPNLLDALMIRVDVEDNETGLQISMLATDNAAAEKLESIMMDGYDMARMIALGQLEATLIDEGAVPDATRAYGQRLGDKIKVAIKPERKGRTLTYRMSPTSSVFLPVLMGAISVPLQQARFAAMDAAFEAEKGMDPGNTMKQLGLAMHNYHSAFKRLPAAVNRDADGKPLLSWRVHILPFIEEQALYQEFHLDEPWDSDHNIKLLERMPAYYSHPDFEVAAGKTVFQVPVGDGMMFETEKQTRFRDVLDGLSNTIMIVASDADSAVEWSKPQDLEIDLENPAKTLGIVDGLNVMMGDGALRHLSEPIDSDLLGKMFTRAGGERHE